MLRISIALFVFLLTSTTALADICADVRELFTPT